MKKAVSWIQTMSWGGAEVFWSDILESLQKQGVEIELWTTHQEWSKQMHQKGIPTKTINPVMDIVGDWKGLVKAITFSPYAVLHSYDLLRKAKPIEFLIMTGVSEKIIVTPLAHLLKIPVIWVEYGPVEPLLKKWWGLIRAGYSRVEKIPRAVIVPTEFTKKSLLKTTGIPSNKIKVIPCGRNLKIHPIKKHNSTSSAQQIICVSRLEKGKGQDLLIKAFKLVLKKYPQAQLKIVGQGDFEAELYLLIKELQLSKNVSFSGFETDLSKVWEKATVAVFPSVWGLEGFGLVTIEAMAHGVPIVAFNRGPTPEIVENNKSGLLAKTGSVEDLAHKIMMILEDKKLSESLAREGQKRFKEKYTIESVTKKYQEILL